MTALLSANVTERNTLTLECATHVLVHVHLRNNDGDVTCATIDLAMSLVTPRIYTPASTDCIVLSYVQISQSNSTDRYEIVRDTLIAFQSAFTSTVLLLVIPPDR